MKTKYRFWSFETSQSAAAYLSRSLSLWGQIKADRKFWPKIYLQSKEILFKSLQRKCQKWNLGWTKREEFIIFIFIIWTKMSLLCLSNWMNQRTLTLGKRITELDFTKQENLLLFVCTETTESKPIRLETSHKYSDTSTYGECSLDVP